MQLTTYITIWDNAVKNNLFLAEEHILQTPNDHQLW